MNDCDMINFLDEIEASLDEIVTDIEVSNECDERRLYAIINQIEKMITRLQCEV